MVRLLSGGTVAIGGWAEVHTVTRHSEVAVVGFKGGAEQDAVVVRGLVGGPALLGDC